MNTVDFGLKAEKSEKRHRGTKSSFIENVPHRDNSKNQCPSQGQTR